jgi:tetratricopeptide (TPR) repeat protein
LASYRRRRLALLEQAHPMTGAYPESLATTWAMNIADVEQVSPAAAELLRVSAFLAPDAIPLEILVDGAPELGLTIAAALAGAKDDPVRVYEVLEPLTRFSLVQLDPNSNAYSVHRLVEEVVRGAMDEDSRREWARRAVRGLNRMHPPASFPVWPLWDRLVPHARVAAELVCEYGFEYDDAGALLNEAASFLRMRADFAASERMHRQTLALAEAGSPADEPRTSASLNNLAIVYSDQFRYHDAEPLFVRALDIAERAGGENDALPLALHNLAGLYVKMGRFTEAEALIERALKVWQPESEDDAFFTALLLNTRAEVHLGLGRLERAMADAEEALAMRERIGNPEKTARSYTTLGYALCRLGRYAEADRLFMQALAMREGIYSPSHPEWVLTLERRAELLRAVGRDAEAQASEERAQAIRRAVVPGE